MGCLREGRRSERSVADSECPACWYGPEGESWAGFTVADIAGSAGTGGIALRLARRSVGGALGWLRLTLSDSSALAV